MQVDNRKWELEGNKGVESNDTIKEEYINEGEKEMQRVKEEENSKAKEEDQRKVKELERWK